MSPFLEDQGDESKEEKSAKAMVPKLQANASRKNGVDLDGPNGFKRYLNIIVCGWQSFCGIRWGSLALAHQNGF